MRLRALAIVMLFVVVMACWIGLFGRANGQEASSNSSVNFEQPNNSTAIPPASDDAIQAWLDELAAPNFQLRRQAFMRLWEQGKPALPSVRSAAQAGDRQIAGAAKVLEMLLRLEILPQNNIELSELLQLARVPPQQAVLTLVKKGQWKLAAEYLKSSESERVVYRPGANLWLCAVTQDAMEQGDPRKAWPILQLSLSPVHRAWLSEKMQLPLDQVSVNRDDRAMELMFRGKIQEAIALQPSVEVLQRIVYHSGNWEQLQNQPLRSHILGAENDTLVGLAQRAAFAYLSNDVATSEKLIGEVLEQLKVKTDREDTTDPNPPGRSPFGREGSEGFDLRTQTMIVSLLLCGQGGLVKDFMTEDKVRDNLRYFEADLDYSRILGAFKLKEDFGNFDTWLDQTIAELRPNLKRATTARGLEQYRQLCDLSTAMVAMGKAEYAMRLYQRLMDATRDAPAQYRDNIWSLFTRQTRLSFFRPHAIRLLDNSGMEIGDEVRERMFAMLYPEWGFVALALWKHAPAEFVQTVDPKEAESSSPPRRNKRWSAMERLWRFDRQMLREEPAALENWLRGAQREASRMEENASIAAGQFSRLALQLGMRELALSFANSGKGVSALADVAEVYSQNNALPQAIRWWDAAIDQDPRDHLKILRNINAKRIAGEDESAEQLELSRWLRPLDVDRPSLSYMSVAEDLYEEGNFEQSRDYAEAAFAISDLRVSTLFSSKRFATVLNELEEFKRSADANRVANVILFMEPNIGMPLSWIQHTITEEFLTRALADLKEGNVEAALDRIRRFEGVRPAGIEICEHTYGRLVQSGRKDAAESLLERCSSRMLSHLEKWPDDAGAHNNYAWMLARCNQRLDEALSHSELAVKLSDGLPTYVDTLAEAHFRLGNIDQAIDLTQRCISLDPRHSHYRKQLVRFREEKKKSAGTR